MERTARFEPRTKEIRAVMRNVVGVLVAAVVGVHCGAAPDSLDDTQELAVADTAEQRRSTPESDDRDAQASPGAPAVDLAALLGESSSAHVTSRVTDAAGATYAAGTFVGTVAVGDTVIKSRGDKDVFVMKLGPTGAFEWVRAVGSIAPEGAPRVSVQDGLRVTILGMTKGEMDCGTGPLNTWDSSMFFVCIFGSDDGKTLNAGVFPTGNL
jgi:hypothetical protein